MYIKGIFSVQERIRWGGIAGVIKNLGIKKQKNKKKKTSMASILAASSVNQVTLHVQLLVFLLETITKEAPILPSLEATQQTRSLLY